MESRIGSRRRRCALILGSTLLAMGPIPGLGNAQEAADQDLTSLTIEELAHLKISSASRYLEDARKAPSVVTIITADEITRYGWRTLAELLRTVPGFYSAYDRNYTWIGVRGFLQSGDFNARFLLMIDGHRVNENVYDSALVGKEFPLDLDLIDRVEVVSGPSSSLYGTNAVLAAVNVITRRSKGSRIEVAAETESFYERSGRLTGTFEKGQVHGLISGSFYRNPGASRLYFPEFDGPETNYGIANQRDGENSTQTFIDVERGKFRIEGLYGSRFKVVPTGSYATIFNDPANHTIDTRGYVDASYGWNLSPQTELQVRGYYDAYRFRGGYAYALEEGLGRTVEIDDEVADWIGAEAVLGHKMERHRVVLGSDAAYNLRIDQRNQDIGQAPFFEDQVKPVRTAGFGEIELNLTQKLTVNAGGRVDWYDTFGATASPRVAVMYLPSLRTSLKYIVGRSFRAPDPYDIYYVDKIDVDAPSKNLKPENFWAHTVVFEHNPKTWLGIRSQVFFNQLDDVIENQLDPGTGLTHFANTAGDHSLGTDFAVEAKRASGWAARASYTFADSWQRKTNSGVANSPTHLAKLNATIPTTRRGYSGVELLYCGEQWNYLRLRVSSAVLTNITFSTRPLWGGWRFSASAYNVFNQAWATPTGPDVPENAIRQDGRGFRFKITYRLPFERGHK